MDVSNVSELWQVVASNGIVGLLLGLGVFVLVFLFRYSGFVKNGNVARVIAGASALLIGGASLGDVDANVSSILGILVSGFIHEVTEAIAEKRKK